MVCTWNTEFYTFSIVGFDFHWLKYGLHVADYTLWYYFVALTVDFKFDRGRRSTYTEYWLCDTPSSSHWLPPRACW